MGQKNKLKLVKQLVLVLVVIQNNHDINICNFVAIFCPPADCDLY